MSAFTLAAEQRRVVVDIPCGHLTPAQCEKFTALANEFMPGFVSIPVKFDSGRSGVTCPKTDFDTLERCYADQLGAVRQPIGRHIGLKADEAALIVLLFDPRQHVNTILGSSLFVPRGGNYTLSSFALRSADIASSDGTRPVYVVSGGALADSAFAAGLRQSRRRYGTFATSANSWLYGDLAIDR